MKSAAKRDARKAEQMVVEMVAEKAFLMAVDSVERMELQMVAC